jgi:hypothetical protein
VDYQLYLRASAGSDGVQRYPVRNTHRSRLTTTALEETARAVFGEARVEGDRVSCRFGAITSLATWAEGKELAVDVHTDPSVDAATQAESIRRYNQFLEEATGFSSKERAKRLRKSAQGSVGGS